MRTPYIKICGLMTEDDIYVCNEYRPEYVGFMFCEKSKRYITPETAAGFKKILDPSIRAVGVFVDEPVSDVAKIANQGIIDIVQLHGSESDRYIELLKDMIRLPVFKAISVRDSDSIRQANMSSADMILVDSGTGGTGTVFDWELLKGIKRDYFLAGGLSPDNVMEALRLEPYAMDVSSGVETDGRKDKDKIAAFIKRARGI